MSRNSIVAAVLVLTLATSASACVEGAGSPLGKACFKFSRAACERNLGAKADRCNPVLKSVPAHCDIRGLVQFHAVAFAKFEVRSPLHIVADRILAPSRQGPRVSSIGSPQTDRGPPLS